jgi:apolipoprotein N-acyltransferase
VTRALYATAFALLFALAFPFRAGDLHFDLGLLCGWLAPIPFALMLRDLAPRRALLWGFGAATAGFCGVFPWIWVVVHVHGHAASWIAVLAVVGLAIYCGLHFGLAAWLTRALEPYAGLASVLVLPAAWVVCEFLRTGSLANGFPWAFLGYSAHRNGPLLELASLGGVYGLSFLMVLTASLAVRRQTTAAVLIVVAAHVLGFGLRLSAEEQSWARPLHAGVVQASIPQDQKWDPALARDAFDAHLSASRLTAEAGPVDLIVWPEASAPVFLEAQGQYRSEVVALAEETGAELLVGGMGLDPLPGGRDFAYFNSIFVVSPEDGFVERYDKSILVPFGEYVPWRSLLGFLSGLATGLASGDVTPGPGARVIPVAGVAVAPLVCYEVLYPAAVRDAARAGARLLVNVTNDAWYGRSSAPHQFLAMAAMRSAEHGLPMLRAANTGVSAVVDAGGWVLRESEIFEPIALRVGVPGARPGPTLYTQLGDWIVWVGFGILIFGGGARVVGKRRSGARSTGATASSRRADRRAPEASLTSHRSRSD